MENKRAKALATVIRASDKWNPVLLSELCELADMTDEWQAADDRTFESVAAKAAEKLGVEI